MTLTEFYNKRWETIAENLGEMVDPTDVRDPYISIKKPNPIMIIGEAPGGEEVERGEPFCGPAGKNLRYLIEQSGLDRSTDFLITNALPFRTFSNGFNGRKNRTPTKDELRTGSLLLEQELVMVKPSVILILGGSAKTAVKFIPDLYNEVKDLERNTWKKINIYGFDTIVTHAYHPSPLVYNQKAKAAELKTYFKTILPNLFKK